MQTRVTAKIKIPITPEIVRTIKVYGRALQFCINTAWKNKVINKFRLQSKVYRRIRSKGLQAQLAITCIRQACEMVKRAKSKPIIKNVSIRYNLTRSFSFKNNILSIATIKGRQKFKIDIPDCYKEYFDWDISESLLRIDKKGRAFFLFTFTKEVSTKSSGLHRVLGIDLGVNNLAVTSEGKVFKGHKTKIIQFRYLRRKLQRKGTKSAKRKLKVWSGREKRFMRWVNHNVSKEIVCNADIFVLENLKGIRKIRKGKRFNRWLNNWSFYQLQSFIKYKAEREGKKVVFVNPYLTSQTCSNCLKLGSRYLSSFVCSHCGFSCDADLNASFNLRRLNVTKPNVSNDNVKGSLRTTATEFRDKISV